MSGAASFGGAYAGLVFWNTSTPSFRPKSTVGVQQSTHNWSVLETVLCRHITGYRLSHR